MHPESRHPPLGDLQVWNDPTPRTGPENMAVDQAVFQCMNAPVLRVYRWSRREISFGYPMRWNAIESFAAGRPAVRRWTGGGIVEHGDDLTLTLAIPASEPLARLPLAMSYERIHRAVAAALAHLGMPSILAGCSDASQGAACFAHPAPSDLLANGRKILGGAQRRTREGLLYQGSLQGIGLPPDFPAALPSHLADHAAPWLPPSSLPDLVTAISAERYATPDWNRKR